MKKYNNIHIGIALPHPRYVFWSIVGYGAKQQAAELGVAISVVPSATTDEQIAVIEQFVRQRVDAVIVGPIDIDGMSTVVANVRAAGIPVITVDVDIPGNHANATVRSDNSRGAALGAEYLVQQLQGMGKIVHLKGTAQSPSAAYRAQGLYQVLERYPGVEVALEARGDWTSASGFALMQEALAKHDDIRGVFAANDPMALGAAEAVKAAGLQGDVCVVGFDALPETLLAIHQGTLAATVGQDPRSMGRIAVELAVQAIQSVSVAPLVLTDVSLVTADTLLGSALNSLQVLPSIMRDISESNEQQQRLQQQVIAAQQQIIQELSSPIIPISDKILVLPLVGSIDTARANRILESMLDAITTRQAEVLIIDITGVPVVDTAVAHHLVQATRAVQLLGARAILVGITPEVAQIVVQLGIDLSTVETKSSLQLGLEFAMTRLSRTAKNVEKNRQVPLGIGW
jgi:ribose transport system substrate-binding protein